MTATPERFDSQKRLGAPVAILAELTHRCPLGCPYCSNPLALDPREDELSTSDWTAFSRKQRHSAFYMRIFLAANRRRGRI